MGKKGGEVLMTFQVRNNTYSKVFRVETLHFWLSLVVIQNVIAYVRPLHINQLCPSGIALFLRSNYSISVHQIYSLLYLKSQSKLYEPYSELIS